MAMMICAEAKTHLAIYILWSDRHSSPLRRVTGRFASSYESDNTQKHENSTKVDQELVHASGPTRYGDWANDWFIKCWEKKIDIQSHWNNCTSIKTGHDRASIRMGGISTGAQNEKDFSLI